MCANNVICNQLIPNRSLDCYALMNPSFCHPIIIITLMTDLG